MAEPVDRLPLFPVTSVGSLPRPRWLIQVMRDREAGNVPDIEWRQLADHAALEALRAQEQLRLDIVNDGEQRRDGFYSFIAQKVAGLKLMAVSEMGGYLGDRARFDELLRALDVPSAAIRCAVAVDELRVRDEREGLALDELGFIREHTSQAVKITLPGPYLLTRSAWVPALSSRTFEEPEDLARSIVRILREEILRQQEGGVDLVQLDEPALMQLAYADNTHASFMAAALPPRADPAAELELAVRLVNEVTEGIEGMILAVHVCRGNWSRKEDVLLSGDYEPLLPFLMAMNVHQLVLEMATPRAGSMRVFKDYRGRKQIGLGVVNPRTDEVETPASIIERVREALQYFEPEQISLNPDCGFGSFAERNVNTAETASAKLAAMVEAAKRLREEFG